MGTKKWGYARVSTRKQTADSQIAPLIEAGVDRESIFIDVCSGSVPHGKRPSFQEMQKYLREGDVVYFTRLDRLARSTSDLLEIASEWQASGIDFVCTQTSGLDTTTPTGKLVFTVLAAVAEMERDLIRARVNEGLEAARENGRVGGRPRADQAKIDLALKMHSSGGYSVREITLATGVSKSSLYRYVRERKS